MSLLMSLLIYKILISMYILSYLNINLTAFEISLKIIKMRILKAIYVLLLGIAGEEWCSV